MAERGRKSHVSGQKSGAKKQSGSKEKADRPVQGTVQRGKKSKISGMDVGQDGRGIPLQGFRRFYE